MITSVVPGDWRALQVEVGRVFQECEFEVSIEETVETVRGKVELDIVARDKAHAPPLKYICECKHWQHPVPKTVVHAFRSVLSDYGANVGLIVSSAGFQAGASEAARNSSVELLTWEGFPVMFFDRWRDRYMYALLDTEIGPLGDYTEGTNGGIYRRINALPPDEAKRFQELRTRYGSVAFLPSLFRMSEFGLVLGGVHLPLREDRIGKLANVPDNVLDARAPRELCEAAVAFARRGLEQIDQVFGGRVEPRYIINPPRRKPVGWQPSAL